MTSSNYPTQCVHGIGVTKVAVEEKPGWVQEFALDCGECKGAKHGASYYPGDADE